MKINITVSEKGRTMMETIAVIVIITLLTLAAFNGYQKVIYRNEANRLYEEMVSEAIARLNRGTVRAKESGLVDAGWKKKTTFSGKKYEVEEDCPQNGFVVKVDKVVAGVCEYLMEKQWESAFKVMGFYRSEQDEELCSDDGKVTGGYYIHTPKDCYEIKEGIFALIVSYKGETGNVKTCNKAQDCYACQYCDSEHKCRDNCQGNLVCFPQDEQCHEPDACVAGSKSAGGTWRDEDKVVQPCPKYATCSGGTECTFTCDATDDDDPPSPLHKEGNRCVSCDDPRTECLKSGEAYVETDENDCPKVTRYSCTDTQHPSYIAGKPICFENNITKERECVECVTDSDCSGRATQDQPNWHCDNNHLCVPCPSGQNITQKCSVEETPEDVKDEYGCVIERKIRCSNPQPKCNTSTGRCESCPSNKPYYDQETNTCYCPAGAKCPPDGNPPYEHPYQCTYPTGAPHGAVCGPQCPCGSGLDCQGGLCQCSTGKYWNTFTNSCTSCLRDYDGSKNTGACETTQNPICQSNGTCGPCPTGTWSTALNACVSGCPTSLPGKGAACTENCGCSSGYVCDSTSHTCKCNGDCPDCTTDNDCAVNTQSGKTVCTQNQCTCPTGMISNGNGKCVYCWNEGNIVHGCSGNKSVCNEQGNNGLGECVCPSLPDQNQTCNSVCGCASGFVCSEHICQCPTGTYWNDSVARCTACLGTGHDYGSDLVGSCTSILKPMCNASYECESCPDGKSWDANQGECIETYLPGQIIYEKGCENEKKCSCGTDKCGEKKTITFYPGYYEVIAIGAGGGSTSGRKDKKTNVAFAATGGSGASFQGTLHFESREELLVSVGIGGKRVVRDGVPGTRAGTGGATYIGSASDPLISCGGGKGGYIWGSGKNDGSGGKGAEQCQINDSYVSSTKMNNGGNRGSHSRCKHSGCKKDISGSSAKITTNMKYGGVCSFTFGWRYWYSQTPNGRFLLNNFFCQTEGIYSSFFTGIVSFASSCLLKTNTKIKFLCCLIIFCYFQKNLFNSFGPGI